MFRFNFNVPKIEITNVPKIATTNVPEIVTTNVPKIVITNVPEIVAADDNLNKVEKAIQKLRALWLRGAAVLRGSHDKQTANIGSAMQRAALLGFLWECEPRDLPRSWDCLDVMTKLFGVLYNVL